MRFPAPATTLIRPLLRVASEMSLGEVRPKTDRNREDRLRYAAKARGLRAKKHHRGGSAIPLRELQRRYRLDKEEIRKNRGLIAFELRGWGAAEEELRAEFTGVRWEGEPPLWTLFDLDKPLTTGTIGDIEEYLAELHRPDDGETIRHPDGNVWAMAD